MNDNPVRIILPPEFIGDAAHSDDGIHMAQHSGLFDEELAYQGEQAENYPLGPKEYWRSEMVGKYTYGLDNHFMTNEEFEEYWCDFEEDDSAEHTEDEK